jgi:D-lactate dehydrogenase (cytochrome)
MVTSPTAMALDDLAARLGDRLTVNPAVRDQHGVDEGWHAGVAPEAVVFPSSTDEVAAIIRTCAARRVPVVAFGAGTSLEGHVAAVRGGVCVDLSGMDRILAVNPDDLDVTVEAGVRRLQLDERLRRDGLFFPIDPGADATIGGMTATRASGTNAVRYGTMRDNVLALTAVMADGSVVRTGGRARKSSAGYDLTRLLVGSEGTLGIITEVTLRVQGVPEAIGAAVVSFDLLQDAVDTVIRTIQLGVPVARIELLDEVMVTASNAYADLDHPEAPTLFLEFHGTEAAVAEQEAYVRDVAAQLGGGRWRSASDPRERRRLWQARHDALYAGLAMRPGAKAFTSDVCVPISRLTDCILETRKDIDAAGAYAPIVGHVGDGNFHVLYTVDPDDPDELASVQELNRRLVHRALEMGGTCTGEHGIGYGKLEFMEAEHGPAALAVMRAVKQALDPHDLLNPGKILPPPPDL